MHVIQSPLLAYHILITFDFLSLRAIPSLSQVVSLCTQCISSTQIAIPSDLLSTVVTLLHAMFSRYSEDLLDEHNVLAYYDYALSLLRLLHSLHLRCMTFMI